MEELFELPVAHGEGKFLPKDETALEELMGLGQIVLHYSDPTGAQAGYPFNPNGSVGSIAGICDPTGRIFGLMPHPERHLWAHQHPRARSEGREGLGAGGTIFKNGIRWAEKHVS